MKIGTNRTMKMLAIIAALCLSVACLSLIGCGGSSGSSSAASSSGSSSVSASSAASASAEASASIASVSSESTSATDPAAKFVGKWMIAAAEQNGVIMGGNLGEFLGADGQGALIINADGTGSMTLGDESTELTWVQDSEDAIFVTKKATGDVSTQTSVPVTYKDDALFMEIEQEGQKVNGIFTHDGTYADAKQISLDGATPITSAVDLIGTWKLVGLNMGGISMTGDAENLQSLMSSSTSITFKEDGVVEMETGNGTWAVDANGATITSKGFSGDETSPILKIGDEIAIDYSASFGGVDFITVFAK